MAEKEKEWKGKLEVATTEQSDSIRAPKSDEDIEAWARKYPDVAAIVETLIRSMTGLMNNLSGYVTLSMRTQTMLTVSSVSLTSTK